MTRQQPIRVGIVGVGWGALVHAPAYRVAEGYELVAICGRRQERAEQAGERLGIADVSTDWKSFVRRDDLDLISVATPVDLHVEIGLAALDAGKHLLCEKPLALDSPSARRLYDAAAKTDRATAVCHEIRWAPHRLPVWDLMRAGYLGDPYFVRIVQSMGNWHPSHAPQSDWMYRKGEGGGYLMGLQSHDIDFVRTLLGDVAEVCADVKTTRPKVELADGRTIDVDADDTATILMRMRSGATAVLTSSVVGLHATGQVFDAFGSKGTITMERDGSLLKAGLGDPGLSPLERSTREPRGGAVESKGRSSVMIRATALLLEEWLPAFEGKPAPSVPSLRDGWKVAQVIDAARASSAGAGWVAIPE